MTTVFIGNADKIMVSARPEADGIKFTFADGCTGMVPFSAVPEIGGLAGIVRIEFPYLGQASIFCKSGEEAELPWDFIRSYCDPTYRAEAEALAAEIRKSFGARLRRIREEAGMTQAQVAKSASIGRVTLSRIENGWYFPRFSTIGAIAKAMNLPMEKLIIAEATE